MAWWIMLAVFGNFVLSGASLLDKKILGRISPPAFLALSELMWLPVLVCVALLSPLFPLAQPFFGQGFALVFPGWNLLFVQALIPGLSVSISAWFYFRAMRMMIPSRVVMLGLMTSACCAAGVGMVIRGKFFMPFEIAAFGLLLSGGLLASFLLYEKDPRHSIGNFRSGFYDVICAGIGWGIYPSLLHSLGEKMPWLSVFFWQNVAGILFALVLCAWYRTVIRECRDAFRRAVISGDSNEPMPFRFLHYFGYTKLLGLCGGYALAFAAIVAPLGNEAFIPAFGGIRYATMYCYEHLCIGLGAGERMRLLATFRILILLVAVALLAGGIFILALYAPQKGA